MKVNIRVSRDDIRISRDERTSYSENCRSCPIYRALQRVLLESADHKVLIDSVYLREKKQRRSLPLPDSARKFIAKYDNREFVRAFTFMMDIPQKFLRHSVIKETKERACTST